MTLNILLCIILIIAGVDYYMAIYEFSEIKYNINLINKSNVRIAEL